MSLEEGALGSDIGYGGMGMLVLILRGELKVIRIRVKGCVERVCSCEGGGR